jgi:subtilase family serine protease
VGERVPDRLPVLAALPVDDGDSDTDGVLDGELVGVLLVEGVGGTVTTDTVRIVPPVSVELPTAAP